MASEDDKVSVVIPVYNSEKFLEESIESVLNQTYKNIEILTVDDGSTDNSLKILHQYENKITILSQKNQGLAASVNNAIEKVNGRWFKWLSPDDVLCPDAIEILVNEAKKLSDNTIVYSNWDIIDENGQELRSFFESDYNDLEAFEFNVRLLDGQQINVNTTLIPTLLFSKGCVMSQLKDPVAIDYDFFLRAGVLYETHFHLVSRSLLKYRIHRKQLSHKNISKTLSYLSEIRNQVLSNLDDSKKERYLHALKEFDKKKPLQKKTMDLGLKIITSALPNWVADNLLVFYLNNMRRTR